MDDDPEMIREQIEQTKSQLSEKLESLELQISETVQSTGTAMNATVEAVQETAQAVTGVVHDAAQSVTNAFDIRRQMDRHPWFVLGGAVAVGYLACELLKESAKKSQPAETALSPSPFASKGNQDTRNVMADNPVAKTTVNMAAYESARRHSAWHQLQDVAIGAMISGALEVVSRSVPRIADYLLGKTADTPTIHSDGSSEIRNSPGQQWPPQVEQRLRVASSGNVRSGDLF